MHKCSYWCQCKSAVGVGG